MIDFWVIIPHRYRRFHETCCLHLQGDLITLRCILKLRGNGSVIQYGGKGSAVPTGRPQSLQFFIKSTHFLLANTPVSVYDPTQSNNPEANCLIAACLSNQSYHDKTYAKSKLFWQWCLATDIAIIPDTVHRLCWSQTQCFEYWICVHH
jgi:hypothetical protein